MELEHLLSTLKGQGSLDSQGRFTLDSRLMLEKLARFQFSQPHTYLLPLMAGLGRLGARRVDLSTTRQGLEIEAECRSPSLEELRHLFDELANPREGFAYRDLALGLYGASRVYKAISWQGCVESQAVRWVFRADTQEISLSSGEAEESPPRVRLQLWPRSSWWQRLLRSSDQSSLPLERLKHAPYEVLHNGHSLRRAFDLKECQVTALIGEELPGHELCQQRRAGSIRGLLGLGARQSRLLVQVQGVHFGCPFQLPYRSLCLIDSPDLSVDLSYAAVVENQQLRELLEMVAEELDRTLLEAVRQQGAESGSALQGWLLELLGRHQRLPDEFLKMELLRTTQGQRKPVGLALRQQEAHGCVLLGQAGTLSNYRGRFVFSRQGDSGWLLDALGLELIELVRTRDGRIVPARLLAQHEVELPHRSADSHWAVQPFANDEGRGVAAIPRTPCSSSTQLTFYVGGLLASGEPNLLPPGLELILDRPPSLRTVPTAQELGPPLTRLYRELVEKHLGQPETLTYLLAYLATAARIFNQMRKGLTTLESRLRRKPDRGIVVGQLGRELLKVTPLEALLRLSDTVPDYIRPQLARLVDAMEVGYFCGVPLLPRAGGARLTILEVAQRKSISYCEPTRSSPAPGEALLLSGAQAGYLAELLGPGRLKRV